METIRQKAEAFFKDFDYSKGDAIDLMVDFAESLDNWIPVEERLPNKEYQPLNLVFNNDGIPTTIYGFYFKEKFWINLVSELTEVTHWQPLPNPPKPKKGE